MDFTVFSFLILIEVFIATMGSTLRPDPNVDGTLSLLTEKIREMESEISSLKLECRESSREVSDRLKDTEIRLMETDSVFEARLQRVETQSLQTWEKSFNLDLDMRKALTDKDKKTEELQDKIVKITTAVVSLKDVPDIMLSFAKNLQSRLDENLRSQYENIQSNISSRMSLFGSSLNELENDASVMKQDLQNQSRKVTDLDVKIENIKSTLPSKEDVSKNMSSFGENLKLQMEESLRPRFDNIQTNVRTNISLFETSLIKLENDASGLKRDLQSQSGIVNGLEVKIENIKSTRPSKEDVSKNISSFGENLKSQMEESLRPRFDNIQTNVNTKISLFETSLNKLETDVSGLKRDLQSQSGKVTGLEVKIENIKSTRPSKEDVSKNMSSFGENLKLQMEESLRPRFEDIETNVKTEVRLLKNSLQTVQKDVTDVKKSQQSNSDQITGLDKQLSEVQNSCPYPAAMKKGYPLVGDRTKLSRNHGAVVTYACQENMRLDFGGEFKCLNGSWTGVVPHCTDNSFDDTFTFEVDLYRRENISCYSGSYQRKEISVALDIGWGEGLPVNATTSVLGSSTILHMSNVPDRRYRAGVFQCGYSLNRMSETVLATVQEFWGILWFEEPTMVANTGDTVELETHGMSSETPKLMWKHNGLSIPSWNGRNKVEIRNVKPSNAGIYECYRVGGHAFMRLIVRKCGKDRHGERCDKTCPTCYNGGVCHDRLGICVCAPGFSGKQCLNACPENHYGPDCKKVCTGNSCWQFMICKPHPYGCSCAAGYRLQRCDTGCESGWYGAGCKQPCHCAKGHCNRFTGACSEGCSPGWEGQSCQIPKPAMTFFRSVRP